MNKHTKGEWMLDGGTNTKGDLFIWQAGTYFGGHAIATVHGEIQEGAEANARRICQCVNNFDKLLDVCEQFVFLKKTNMTKKQVRLHCDIAEAAIAAAKA